MKLFLKVSALNGLSVVVRALSAVALNKVLATVIGPSGYALVGQAQNFASMALSLSSGLIQSGIIKYTAQFSLDQETREMYLRVSLRVTLTSALVFGCLFIVFRRQLALVVLHDQSLSPYFLVLSVCFPFMSLAALQIALMNGMKDVVGFVKVSIVSSIVGTSAGVFLAIHFGLMGALAALLLNQALVFVVASPVIVKRGWISRKVLTGALDRVPVLNLAKFAAMAFTSAIMVPGSHMIVREHLISQFGLEAAGHWQAVWKISEIYLSVATATLSFYYLPKISEARSLSELRGEIRMGYRLVLPLAALMAVFIYAFRYQIILVLFSDAFVPMERLFLWQLVGDVVKIGSFVLGMVVVGRAMTKLFIASEILFTVSFVCLVFMLTSVFGLKGVTIAFAVNYLAYWIFTGLALRKFMTTLFPRAAERDSPPDRA